MNEDVEKISKLLKEELLNFASEIIRIKSYTGQEENVAHRIAEEMKKLDYDEVFIDKMGNVMGRIGNGNIKILFDGHIDTVVEGNLKDWSVDPFGGIVKEGKLYGRGSTDMKSAVAAMVYAGHAVKKLGFNKDITMYVSASVMEEDADGAAILYESVKDNIKPDYVIICEPSECRLAIGHRGRSSIQMTIEGVPCHGSQPEKGVNPVYKMNEVIEKVKILGNEFIKGNGRGGSVALTKIDCNTGSLNSVPSSCSIYLDRRISIQEDRVSIENELEKLIEGTGGKWQIMNYEANSWTGEKVILEQYFPAWEISKEHKLTKLAINAYRELNEVEPEIFKWNFSTNGVASMGMLKIPTIGFGPGVIAMAHAKDEYCPVDQIIEAFKFYTILAKHMNK